MFQRFSCLNHYTACPERNRSESFLDMKEQRLKEKAARISRNFA
jgi:hypothetical protein